MSASLHKWYSRAALDAFADRQSVLSGEIELSRLARFRELLHSDDGAVEVSLKFAERHAGWTGVELEYRADVQLVCQRCLESFPYTLDARVEIGLLDTEAMEQHLPGAYEPVLLEGDRLMPAKLVEDELIVALPLVPRHESHAECGARVETRATEVVRRT
jgi:uncharacterized protein